MKKNNVLLCMKGFLGLFAFALLFMINISPAKAASIDLSDSDVVITEPEAISEEDFSDIMTALEGRELSDGDSFIVNGEFRIDCEVTIIPDTASVSSSKLLSSSLNSTAVSTLSTTTSSYTAVCNINFTSILISTTVGYVTHTVSVTNYDTGLVHINSGSVSAYSYYSTWIASAYGYSIANTNGAYSSASGYASFYETGSQKTALISCVVSVTPGNTPSFSFSQI